MPHMYENLNLLDLPDVVFEKILLYLTYDEIAKTRIVSQHFNEFCQRLLNRGFAQAVQFHAKCFKEVKSQLPRRESKRSNHPLARHNNILNAIETRLSLLKMTYCKYIHYNVCCFIPGKVIDELFRVLHLVNETRGHHIPHEILTELRDISSMAMDYFEEKIVPNLQKITSTQKRLAPSTSASQISLLPDLSISPQFGEPSGSQNGGGGRSSLNAIISDAGGGSSLFPFADDLLDREMRGAFLNLSPPDRLSELQSYSGSGGGGGGSMQLVPVPAETLKSLVSALKDSKAKKTKLERSVSLLQAKVVEVSRKLQEQERTISEQSRLLSEHCVRFTHHNERINEIVNCSVQAEVLDLEAASVSLLGASGSDLEEEAGPEDHPCSTPKRRKRLWTRDPVCCQQLGVLRGKSAVDGAKESSGTCGLWSRDPACSHQLGVEHDTSPACSSQHGGKSILDDAKKSSGTCAKKMKRTDGSAECSTAEDKLCVSSSSCESSDAVCQKDSVACSSALQSSGEDVDTSSESNTSQGSQVFPDSEDTICVNEKSATNSVVNTERIEVSQSASQEVKVRDNVSSLHPPGRFAECCSHTSTSLAPGHESVAADQQCTRDCDIEPDSTPPSRTSPMTSMYACSVLNSARDHESIGVSTIPSAVDQPSITRRTSTPRCKNLRSRVSRTRCLVGKSRSLLKRLHKKKTFAPTQGSGALLKPTQLQVELLKEIIRRERNLKKLHTSLMTQTLGALGSSPRLVVSGNKSLVTHPPLLRTPEGRFILIRSSGCSPDGVAAPAAMPLGEALHHPAGDVANSGETVEPSTSAESETSADVSAGSTHLTSPSLVKSVAGTPRYPTSVSDHSFAHPYSRSHPIWSSSSLSCTFSNVLPTFPNRDSTCAELPSTPEPTPSAISSTGSAACRYLTSTVQASRAMANSCRQRRLRLGQKYARFKSQVHRETRRDLDLGRSFGSAVLPKEEIITGAPLQRPACSLGDVRLVQEKEPFLTENGSCDLGKDNLQNSTADNLNILDGKDGEQNSVNESGMDLEDTS